MTLRDMLCRVAMLDYVRVGRKARMMVLCFCLSLPGLTLGASLTGAFTPLPMGGAIDLASEGKLDWGQWGYPTEWSFNHKYGVPPQITYSLTTDEYFTDGPYLLDSGAAEFFWDNGTPFRVVSSTNSSVAIFGDRLPNGITTGFQLQCKASTSLRRLKVYVGTSGAKASFQATLDGVQAYSDSTFDGKTGAVEGYYQLNFMANSAGDMLTVNFESQDPSGYIFLKAATLEGTDAPPTVTITAPIDGSALLHPETLAITAEALDSDGIVTNVYILSGTNILESAQGAFASAVLTNPASGFHSLAAVATDNQGLSVTSFPVSVYITVGGGVLQGSVAKPPGRVNLSVEGTADWVHWGLSSWSSLERKAGVVQRIPNLTLLNATGIDLYQNFDTRIAFSWDDGDPVAQVVDTTTGVFLFSTNNPPAGFQLTVPATNKLCRLKLYTGLFGAAGKLTAWLTDASAPSWTDDSVFDYFDTKQAVFSFRFASPNPSASLRINWTPTLVFVPYFGNLTWQAATLQEEPDPPVLKVVPPPGPGQFALSFLASTGISYRVQFADDLMSTQWQDLTNFAGAGSEVLAVDSAPGPSMRYYRVLVE